MLSCPNTDYKGKHALINPRKKIPGTTNTHSHNVMKDLDCCSRWNNIELVVTISKNPNAYPDSLGHNAY